MTRAAQEDNSGCSILAVALCMISGFVSGGVLYLLYLGAHKFLEWAGVVW